MDAKIPGRMHIKPEDVVFLVDTREQTPLDFSKLDGKKLFRVERATLVTGDYSVRGLEDSEICVERKSLPDILACVGRERERFEKELFRMRAFQCRLVIVEATWEEMSKGEWRSQITPAQLQGSVMRYMTWGIPFHFAKNPHEAARFVANYMWLHTQTCYNRLRSFHDSLAIVKTQKRDTQCLTE